MRIGSRSGLLVLASALTLAPVLALADKTQPKAGPRPPTEAELKKIVAKAINPVEAVAAQGSGGQKLTFVRDWKVKTEGSPQPSPVFMKVEFKVSNSGPTPLPPTTLSIGCQVKLSSSPTAPWVPKPCPAGVSVPALQPGEHKILSGFAYRVGSGVPGGYVYQSKITAKVDPTNAVAEWSENNNSAGWTWE